LNSRFAAALIISYALFLLLPLFCQLMGLNVLINGGTLILFLLVPMILAGITSGTLTEGPKSSPIPPVIGGLAAFFTAYILLGYFPDTLSGTFTYIYYSIQYFVGVFVSGCIAMIFSFLRKSEEQRGIKEKEVVKTIPESDTVKCPYCGREVPADSIFCPLCGGKIREESET